MLTTLPFVRKSFRVAVLGVALTTALTAQTYTTTVSGVTTYNGYAASPFTTEFPLGTAWSATLSWDTGAAALYSYETQSVFRLTAFTLSFTGQTGTVTTTALPNAASFSVDNYGPPETGYHTMQFTTSWGPANVTTGTIFGESLYSINVVLGGNYTNGHTDLTAPPSVLDLADYALTNYTQSGLKIYLNNAANSVLYGNLTAPSPSPVPEPSTFAALAGFIAFGLAAARRRPTIRVF